MTSSVIKNYNREDNYKLDGVFHSEFQKMAANHSSYKAGKSLSKDIEHCQKMLEAVQAKIQDLNLPATINAVAVNKEVSRELYQAKKFIEKISSNYWKKEVAKHQSKLDDLIRIIISAKIGGQITPKMLADNPKFQKFIHKACWHNAAVRYNHVLPVIDGKPGLIYEDKPISYDDLIDKGWKTAFLITKSGASFHWPFHFDKMVPHDHQDASKWGNQYAVEIMTSVKDDPRQPGDHSWLRLKNPQGDIYSFGIFGPMQSCMEGFKQRLSLKINGCADNPDRYETIDQNENHFHGTTIAISKEQFEALQDEMLKVSQKGTPVALLKTNCTGHIKRLVDKVGIRIESQWSTGEFLGHMIFSKKIRHLCNRIIPGFIKTIFSAIGHFFQGLALLLLSAGTRDKKIKEVWGDEFQADVPTFFDKFKTVYIEHPRALRKWQRKIDRWREEEISNLSKKKSELAKQKLELESDRLNDNCDKLKALETELNAIDEKIKKLPYLLPNNGEK